MPSLYDTPSEIDKIPYDAPLSFPEPPKSWTKAKGGRPNNRTETLTEVHVPPVDLSGKWILISGANNGLGKEAALTFASWGANLILACRDPRPSEGHPLEAVEQCKALAASRGHESTVEWWKFDAADLSSVDALAQRWIESGRPLDILCNNAGVGSSPGGTSQIIKTKDGFEFIHQVSRPALHSVHTNTSDQSFVALSTHNAIATLSCQSRSATGHLHHILFPLSRQVQHEQLQR